jgi:ubiquinone/menaquinone biosynthesis C-methylase UbiE
MKGFYKNIYQEMFDSDGSSSWATRKIHQPTEKEPTSNLEMRILEVGEGFHFPRLVSNYKEYIILDIQERKLTEFAAGMEQQGCVNQVIADVARIPFVNKEFYRTILMRVLHHIRDKWDILRENRRVSKPGKYITI